VDDVEPDPPASDERTVDPPRPVDEGGDPACWAHLFEEGDDDEDDADDRPGLRAAGGTVRADPADGS
jgi:hypothetical protein